MTLTNFVAPSPSRTISCANSAANDVSSSLNLVNSSGVSFSEIVFAPLAPLARTTMVSFVDMSPSTEIELNERSTAYVSADWSDAGVMAASVAIMPSNVACSCPDGGDGGAIFGWIIPAPLSIPTILTSLPPSSNDFVRSLGNVSVVMKAFAASDQAEYELPKVAVDAVMPDSTFCIGSS